MPGLLPNVDPEGLLEFSVVYTDRALNHMSQKFQRVMRDISAVLKEAYGARSAVVVPGSGTFGMEGVARQFAGDRHCLVIRNGWFSYRWTQIFEMGRIPSSCTVLKAHRARPGAQEPFAPPPIGDVVAAIRAEKPAVVFDFSTRQRGVDRRSGKHRLTVSGDLPAWRRARGAGRSDASDDLRAPRRTPRRGG